MRNRTIGNIRIHKTESAHNGIFPYRHPWHKHTVAPDTAALLQRNSACFVVNR